VGRGRGPRRGDKKRGRRPGIWFGRPLP